MVKVLLIIDDYNEMIYLQSFLRKLGVDVEGIQSTKKLKETVLGFFPKIVMATLNGKQVNGVQVANSLTRRNGFPKVCLLRSKADKLSEEEARQIGVDAIIDSPVNVRKLIEVIALLGEADQQLLLEKFAKIQARASGEIPVDSEPAVSEPAPMQKDLVSPQDRRAHYSQYLSKIKKPPRESFSRDAIRQFNKVIRKVPLSDDVDQVEAERFQFIKALFRKVKT